MRHVNLDPVCAMVELFAGCLTSLDRTIDNLHTLGHFQLGRVAFERVPTGGGDRTGRYEKAWAGNVSAINRLLNADVTVAGAFGLHVAKRGETLVQRPLCRNRRAGGAERQRILQDVGVVTAFRWNFALEEYVGMRIDKAGQNGGRGKIDYLRIWRNFRCRGIGDALNAIPADDDDLIFLRRVRLAIDQRPGLDHDHRRALRPADVHQPAKQCRFPKSLHKSTSDTRRRTFYPARP